MCWAKQASAIPQIPSLAHQFLDGTITAEGEATLTAMQSAQNFTGSMADFCTTYIDKLSEAYNYGFGVACISLVASMAIYVIFRSIFKHADYNSSRLNRPMYTKKSWLPAQTKERIVALLLVFAVVIFFLDGIPSERSLPWPFFCPWLHGTWGNRSDRLGFKVYGIWLFLL